jgi:hypothetical protein
VEVWSGRYLWNWVGHPGQKKDFGTGPVRRAPNLGPGEIFAGHGRGEGAVDGDSGNRPVASGQEDEGCGREGKAAEAPAWCEEGATSGSRLDEEVLGSKTRSALLAAAGS